MGKENTLLGTSRAPHWWGGGSSIESVSHGLTESRPTRRLHVHMISLARLTRPRSRRLAFARALECAVLAALLSNATTVDAALLHE